jgi:sec-independent protein translocase protein TatA
MAGLGAPELIIILVIVVLLFGASRLPKLARSLGEASKEFKDGVKDGAGDVASKATDATNKVAETVGDKLDGKA